MGRHLLPTLTADGNPVEIEHVKETLYRVWVGDTFIGGIERRGEDDWRLAAALSPTQPLVAVPESLNGPFELAEDAAEYLAQAYGMTTVMAPVDFRTAVEHSMDMTSEQKAHWLRVDRAGEGT